MSAEWATELTTALSCFSIGAMTGAVSVTIQMHRDRAKNPAPKPSSPPVLTLLEWHPEGAEGHLLPTLTRRVDEGTSDVS